MNFLQYEELRKTNPDLYNRSFIQLRMEHYYKHLGYDLFFASGVIIMAKNNSKHGGNTPHIKGDELVQDINQKLVNLISDVANLNDDDSNLLINIKEEKTL